MSNVPPHATWKRTRTSRTVSCILPATAGKARIGCCVRHCSVAHFVALLASKVVGKCWPLCNDNSPNTPKIALCVRRHFILQNPCFLWKKKCAFELQTCMLDSKTRHPEKRRAPKTLFVNIRRVKCDYYHDKTLTDKEKAILLISMAPALGLGCYMKYFLGAHFAA